MPDNNEQDKQMPRGLRAWWRHAFAVDKYDEDSLSDEDKAILRKVAERIHAKKMTSAAILWVESHRNLNFIGSQLMVFSQPLFDMTHPMFNAVLNRFGMHIPPADFPKLARALERRYSIEYFVQQLEELAATDYNKSLPEAGQAEEPEPGAAPTQETNHTTANKEDKD